jgi:hypothetical protein
MRRSIAALLAVFAAPATAEDTPSDQAISAYQLFYQGLSPEGLYEGGYFDAVTAGIEGKWIAGTYFLLNDNPDAETLRTKLSEACSGPIIAELSVVEPFTIKVRNPRPENEFTQTYVYAGGTRFTSQVDAREFLEYLYLTEDHQRQSAIQSLYFTTQDVMIFRPSADVLIVARPSGNPDIYTRCIEGDGATVDTAALEAALGKAFDGQYPKAKNPAVRAAFVACAVEAFAPLPASDIQLAVDTDFDPPVKEQERIEAAYPEVNEAARACAEAAGAALDR